MKIRADFVTNSSSSSFTRIVIESNELITVLKQYEDECSEIGITLCDEEMIYETDNDIMQLTPKNKSQIITRLIDLIFELGSNYETDTRGIRTSIKNNEACINNSINSVAWEFEDYGYGGDHEGRFNRDYSDEEIRKYLELTPDEEITDEIYDRFWDYVGDHESLERSYYHYSEGKEQYDYEYKLIEEGEYKRDDEDEDYY